MPYIVYIVEMTEDGRTYRRTKKRCQTLAEAQQEQEKLMERTGKFHEIREG
jgi:hypothetical protein